MRAVLCFADAEWGLWARPFVLRGVTVTWPGALAALLGAGGPLGRDETVGPLRPPRPGLSTPRRPGELPVVAKGSATPRLTGQRFAGLAPPL